MSRPSATRGSSGNFVAEWFGHRVWPTIDASDAAVANQSGCLCPFLSSATTSIVRCAKTAKGLDEPTGVCTISSDSNGARQDWLACPHRTLDAEFTLLVSSIRTTYRVPQSIDVLLLPVTVLHLAEKRRLLVSSLTSGRARVFLFSANKIGGEVDLPESEASPGGKIDISVIEVTEVESSSGEPVDFGQHMFYEIQTADFHGSPLHAVRKLRELLPTHTGPDYHRHLRVSPSVAGEGVEGPNKANIFKRTIYQLILKIQLSQHDDCAGFVMVLPVPVWDSWLRHLGRPNFRQMEGNLVQLMTPADQDSEVLTPARAWIFVFDVDRDSLESPQPLKVVQRVATTSAALVHYAFEVASEEAMAQGVVEKFRSVLKGRVREGWQGNRPGQR